MLRSDQVLDRFWNGRLPVDAESIAKQLGAECKSLMTDCSRTRRVLIAKDIAEQQGIAFKNNFAMRLLVPRGVLKYMITEKSIVTVRELADIFDVPQSLMIDALNLYGIVK